MKVQSLTHCVVVVVHSHLNEFIFNDLCSLQLCLNHFDELGCAVFGSNFAETSLLNEL